MSIATGLAIQVFFNEASPSAGTFRTGPNGQEDEEGPRQRRQGQAQSLYAALSGAGGALGALYAGSAWQVSGALAAFAGASLAALAGAFLILLSVRRTLHDPAA